MHGRRVGRSGNKNLHVSVAKERGGRYTREGSEVKGKRAANRFDDIKNIRRDEKYISLSTHVVDGSGNRDRLRAIYENDFFI